MPALPQRCPHCEREEPNRNNRLFYSGVVRSPIRGGRTGFARVSQVLVDQLLRELREDQGLPQDAWSSLTAVTTQPAPVQASR